MISRQHRFHGHNSLKRLYQSSRIVRGPMISLRYSLNDRRKDYRCAVVVSRKVSKSAIVRNRIRRRIYETVRLDESNISKPFDFVFVVYSERLADLPATQIKKLVKAQLSDAGILKT